MSGVVFLAFKSENTVPEYRPLIMACEACRNKTYRMVVDESQSPYPMLECAACDARIGHVGWVKG